MKKQLLLLLALLLSELVCASTITREIGGVNYKLDTSEKTAEVVNKSYEGDVTIPDVVSYENVEYKVTSIGESAFRDCSKLTSVAIGHNVTDINWLAFYRCKKLETVTMGNKVKTIGDGAFSECEQLASINLSNTVTFIGSYAFNGCSNLTSIIIPDGVTTIGSSAFSGCSSLSSITLPKGVTSIANNLFNQCSSLTSVSIGENVESIDEKAFYFCSELTSVVLPNSVKTICSYAFGSCFKLNSIVLSNSLETIGLGAFDNCSSLTSLTIPSSVKEINIRAFNACKVLNTLKVQAGNTMYDSRNNCNAIIQTSTNTLVIGCKGSTIPNNVTSIGDDAFSGCDFKTIVIPSSVKTIGARAFSASSLTSVIIPEGTTTIGQEAFCPSGLFSVSIPKSLTSIGYAAFANTPDILSVKIARETPLAICNYDFSNRENATLYVPYGSKTAYGAADYWKEFKEILEIWVPSPNISFVDANVKAICVSNWDTNGDGELSEAEAAAVTDIGEVFKGNTSIKSFNELKYFTKLKDIHLDAFWGCMDLVSVHIPDNVSSIGSSVFRDCSSLTSINIPSSVASIGNNAFAGCSSLTSVIIPDKVTRIEDCTFRYCKNLANITIPEGLTHIGWCAFEECLSLKTIKLPESMETISEYAFWYCNLTEVFVGMKTPIIIPSETTFPSRKDATLYVPVGCKALYEAADYWKEFKIIISKGSQESPFTPDEATSYIETLEPDVESEQEFYIKGRVCYIRNQFNPSNGHGTFYITEDGVDSENRFLIYRTLYLDNKAYQNDDRILFVGDEVIVCGKVVYYQGKIAETKEKKSYIYSLNGYVPDGQELGKCATPTINYKDGEIVFGCETEGVKFVSQVTTPNNNTYTDDKLNLNTTYHISVYAAKEGYKNSDVVDADIQLLGLKGDADGNGIVDIADAVHIVNFVVGKVDALAPRKDMNQAAPE